MSDFVLLDKESLSMGFLFKKNNIAMSFFVVVLLSRMSEVYAETPVIEIHGFATAGLILGDTDKEFISGTEVIGESAAFGADNSVGVQLKALINEQVSFTTQLLAKGTIEGYNLEAHWAFIDYHPAGNLSLRGGLLVLPTMMVSEYVDVGYAYPWVRPPAEVYSNIPLTSYSGVDLLYTLELDSVSLTFQPYIGSIPNERSIEYDLKVKSGMGMNSILRFDQGSLRVQVMSTEKIQVGNSFTEIKLDADIVAVGADIEIANVLVMAEYLKKDFNLTGLPGFDDLTSFNELSTDAWYLTLGYRMDKFMPHITYASADTEQAPLVLPAGTPIDTALGPVPSPVAMILPPTPFSFRQKSLTLGLRYDFLPRAVLKMDLQHTRPFGGSWGLFTADPGNSVDLFSLAVDVTF
ncbi:MAG: hypothetical protein KUG80_08580 [Gammaproteobacteria bacterium]|nr:hypothetical protein [Gammaproteobacteria bacterium]